MPIFNTDGLGLMTLELNELSLDDALSHLMLGDTLIIKKYEQTRDKDVLIKLDRRRHVVTTISLDVNPIVPGRRLWQIHNVSFNTLSLHEVYLFDESTCSIEFKYKPNDVVQRADQDSNSVYLIKEVHVTPEKDVYYTLETLDGYFKENELIPFI